MPFPTASTSVLLMYEMLALTSHFPNDVFDPVAVSCSWFAPGHLFIRDMPFPPNSRSVSNIPPAKLIGRAPSTEASSSRPFYNGANDDKKQSSKPRHVQCPLKGRRARPRTHPWQAGVRRRLLQEAKDMQAEGRLHVSKIITAVGVLESCRVPMLASFVRDSLRAHPMFSIIL